MTDTITLCRRSVVEQALEDLEMTINYVQSPTRREDVRDSIEALRAALEQPDVRIRTSVPAGWKLVPVEPTDEMVEAGDHEIEKWGVDASSSGAFRAMLAAAPQPPVVEQPQTVTDCHQSKPKSEQEPVSIGRSGSQDNDCTYVPSRSQA